MGRLGVIKSGPLATIQDYGRIGFRKYGIPQSGAMDVSSMDQANAYVGNPPGSPVIEFALIGIKFLALEKTNVSVVGANAKVNGNPHLPDSISLLEGDELEVLPPTQVYGYIAIGGTLKAQHDFGSYSTYQMGGFGGYEGRALKKEDILETDGNGSPASLNEAIQQHEEPVQILYMVGPESNSLEQLLDGKSFKIDPSSNRMGIRLIGNIKSSLDEIASSAVIPGTIQLPPGGQPIILMNDCQTTGGYPRIGKVMNDDLGKLAQIRAGNTIQFKLIPEY